MSYAQVFSRALTCPPQKCGNDDADDDAVAVTYVTPSETPLPLVPDRAITRFYVPFFETPLEATDPSAFHLVADQPGRGTYIVFREPGLYRISFTGSFSNSTYNRVYLVFWKNESTFLGEINTTASAPSAISFTRIAAFDQGDSLRIDTYLGEITIQSAAFLSLIRVGDITPYSTPAYQPAPV